jgi:two-component system, OmpR family, heavy metal sensor histidine kinase CusS
MPESASVAGSPEGAPDGSTLRSWSLGTRLTIWYTMSAFALVVASAAWLYFSLVRQLDAQDDLFLVDQVHVLQMILREHPNDLKALEQEALWESSARQESKVYVRVLDEHGTPILETPRMAKKLPASLFPAAVDDPTAGEDVVPGSDRPYRLIAGRAALGENGPRRIVQVGLDRDHTEDLLESYRFSFFGVCAAALAGCALVGRRITRRGMRPIERIADHSRRIESSNLHERIDPKGLPSELLALAENENRMLDRLEESFDRLARFSADIAHELRTPIGNLRGEIEVSLARARTEGEYRRVLESSLEECRRISRIIDSLLFLARAENHEELARREPVDVAKETALVFDFFEAAAVEAGIELRCDFGPHEGIEAELDRTLFQQALSNLMENAIAHTPRGGGVTLCVGRDGERVRIDVVDDGCGIAAEDLPHVFDRFYRADRARTSGRGGAGLGLAIVRRIVELHGGTVEIASRAGEGTRVTLRFPSRPSSSTPRPLDCAR